VHCSASWRGITYAAPVGQPPNPQSSVEWRVPLTRFRILAPAGELQALYRQHASKQQPLRIRSVLQKGPCPGDRRAGQVRREPLRRPERVDRREISKKSLGCVHVATRPGGVPAVPRSTGLAPQTDHPVGRREQGATIEACAPGALIGVVARYNVRCTCRAAIQPTVLRRVPRFRSLDSAFWRPQVSFRR
jgi:hypothetical protein